eukprot:scaffold297860_cov18-Tisochrysis_lutea.AAC.1
MSAHFALLCSHPSPLCPNSSLSPAQASKEAEAGGRGGRGGGRKGGRGGKGRRGRNNEDDGAGDEALTLEEYEVSDAEGPGREAVAWPVSFVINCGLLPGKGPEDAQKKAKLNSMLGGGSNKPSGAPPVAMLQLHAHMRTCSHTLHQYAGPSLAEQEAADQAMARALQAQLDMEEQVAAAQRQVEQQS